MFEVSKNGTLIRYKGNLARVHIPASVNKIGVCAFIDCSCVQHVDIPSSVTSIESSAFEGCISLASMGLPESITGIGDYAFSGCNALDYIIYCGSTQDWNSIAFGVQNESVFDAILCCLK